jgi:hypothetical protein
MSMMRLTMTRRGREEERNHRKGLRATRRTERTAEHVGWRGQCVSAHGHILHGNELPCRASAAEQPASDYARLMFAGSARLSRSADTYSKHSNGIRSVIWASADEQQAASRVCVDT